MLRTPEEVLEYTGSPLPELKLNLSPLNMVENESEI